MSDNSLPKPQLPSVGDSGVGVTPQNQSNQPGSDVNQMPPSARTTVPSDRSTTSISPVAVPNTNDTSHLSPQFNNPPQFNTPPQFNKPLQPPVMPSSPPSPSSVPSPQPPLPQSATPQPPLPQSPSSTPTPPTPSQSSTPTPSFPTPQSGASLPASSRMTPLPNISESPNLGGSGNNSRGGGNNGKGPDDNASSAGKNNRPTLAQVKKSPFRFLPFVVGGLVILAGVIFLISRVFGNNNTPITSDTSSQQPASSTTPTKQVTLTYWGLWETSATLDQILADFQTQNPGVTVNYVKQSPKDYRERLQTAVASGNGPDLYRYHMTWVPMLTEELAPMPQSVMTASEYKQTFYPVATQMLNWNGQIVGIPLMYDGLGLYYNQDYLTAADANPPTTWAELKTLANQLTVRSNGVVERGGLAIGNTSNVEHFSDILGLLMLQNGANPAIPNSPETRDALTFYTNFIKQDKVWSEELPSSTVAFARGDVAMMFAPSWRAHEIMSINPELNFGIAPVPRLGPDKIGWATFWAEGVSSKSKNKDVAWKLLKYLSSAEVQQKLYSVQSQNRAFGEIYSRTDLADQLAGDPMISAYLEDAPSAEAWYLASFTHDNGINDLLIKYYQDAINSILDGDSADSLLPTLQQATDQVLRQYGVTQ